MSRRSTWWMRALILPGVLAFALVIFTLVITIIYMARH
jgi:hypothetical protein